jgi:hypothetical protein
MKYLVALRGLKNDSAKYHTFNLFEQRTSQSGSDHFSSYWLEMITDHLVLLIYTI